MILKDKGIKILKLYILFDVFWFEWDFDCNEFLIYFKDWLDLIKDFLNWE